MVIEHPIRRVRCAIDVEKLLAGSGMASEDVKRCMKSVPDELRPEVERCTAAIKAFIDAWSAATADAKPANPTWIVYINGLDS